VLRGAPSPAQADRRASRRTSATSADQRVQLQTRKPSSCGPSPAGLNGGEPQWLPAAQLASALRLAVCGRTRISNPSLPRFVSFVSSSPLIRTELERGIVFRTWHTAYWRRCAPHEDAASRGARAPHRRALSRAGLYASGPFQRVDARRIARGRSGDRLRHRCRDARRRRWRRALGRGRRGRQRLLHARRAARRDAPRRCRRAGPLHRAAGQQPPVRRRWRRRQCAHRGYDHFCRRGRRRRRRDGRWDAGRERLRRGAARVVGRRKRVRRDAVGRRRRRGLVRGLAGRRARLVRRDERRRGRRRLHLPVARRRSVWVRRGRATGLQ
jgi:hypothetical protein